MTNNGLVIKGVSAHYGPAQALWDVDLTVGDGETVALLGENGAGKTTLLRSLARIHRQASGSARYGSTELFKLAAHQVVRNGISLVRDGARVFENLTIDEHLYLASRLDPQKRSVDEIIAMFPVLQRRGRKVKAGYLSGGQRQALCLAMAVGAGARFLLLDEPSAGLAESTAAEIFELIRALSAQGVSMLIAEQQFDWLDGWATAIAHLEMGRIVSMDRA
jgi:branched-chain amino acid transport system ATP-binding protein